MVERNMKQLSPIMLLSMGYVYSILPVSGVLICVLEFFNLCDTAVKAPAEAGEATDTVKIGPLD
jgi:TRAP-type C4-dicarboxylate transport system permease small subunit